MKRKVDAHMIAIMGLLIALMVILSQVLGIETQFVKLTFTFVPEVVMAILFGPFWTGVGAAIADVTGLMLLPKAAPYFFGFTINAFIGGLVYGYFFYKKEITWLRSFLCVLTNTLVITLCLTPIWLSIMYQVPLDSWALWSVRLLKAGIMLPIETILVYLVAKSLPYKRFAKRFIAKGEAN